MRQVAVLFARADSIYKTMEGCDVWDMERDARKFPGGMPIVGHPPCRAWGVLKHMAFRARPDEKDLARRCVQQIRKWGGVLEHPFGSSLWKDQQMSSGWIPDEFGGWTLEVDQFDWGHPCHKRTKFYIVGLEHGNLPSIPSVRNERSLYSICGGIVKGKKTKRATDKVREHTPPALAAWLVELARRTRKPSAPSASIEKGEG